MTYTPLSPTPFAYIQADVPAGQTLIEWRRERTAAKRAARRPLRLGFLFPRLRVAT